MVAGITPSSAFRILGMLRPRIKLSRLLARRIPHSSTLSPDPQKQIFQPSVLKGHGFPDLWHDGESKFLLTFQGCLEERQVGLGSGMEAGELCTEKAKEGPAPHRAFGALLRGLQ